VTATAHECGYQDANYFSRVFRAHTGQSPKRWQMRHAKDGPR
ncbi:MAG: AraC family transcriptional regulator, partial [Spirochaetia bacterium]|nr:AraC family transcriptional regulator [Spirochaetia bacterium]